MKKLTAYLLTAVLITFGCTKQELNTQPAETSAAPMQRKCAAQEVLEMQMAANPALRQKMQELETFTEMVRANPAAFKTNGGLTIPVVVHVVYNTPEENISDLQIQSQIDVLNQDFNNKNPDQNKVPDEFKDEQTSVGIKFVLARVIRKYTEKKSWGTNDAVKKTQQGGSDPVNPASNLNLWSCNLGHNLLGYAQFPGGSPATDGVVILYSAVGNKGTLISNYNLGRTATHEIGHWMNLRHIWGDASCGNDFVDDTPVAATANFGCPGYPHISTCTGNTAEMTMNYMDYTYDACMYMFSNGQRDRMKAVFVPGGPRAAFSN